MFPLIVPVVKFIERHDQGVDLAAEYLLGPGYPVNDMFETDFSYNEQVDIAFLPGFAPSNGSVKEREGQASDKRFKGAPEYIRNTGRFGDKAPQLIKNGTLRIGLEQNLVILDRAKDDACSGQPLELPLAGARRNPRQPEDLS